MNWKKVKSDFEAWKKKFLAKKDYKINDKRRNLEPTGNEKPPDVYGVPHNPIIVERPGTQCYSPDLSPQELHDLREAYGKPKEQSFADALREQLDMINHEYLNRCSLNSMNDIQKELIRKTWALQPEDVGLERQTINKHDIYDIRIALELAGDVTDFIEEL